MNQQHLRMLPNKLLWSRGFLDDFLYANKFSTILNFSPWKRAWPFVLTNVTNFNTLYQKMVCARFGWNWPSGSREEVKILKSLQTDRLIRIGHLRFQLRWALKLEIKHKIYGFFNSFSLSLIWSNFDDVTIEFEPKAIIDINGQLT